MFDDREFLLCNVRYVPEVRKNLLSISMFDDIGYYIIFKHDVLKISLVKVIIAKWSKIYGLHILESSNVVVHS